MFGAVKVTNTSNPDPDKWQYTGYGICFESTGPYAHTDGNYGRNVIIFGADINNSKHATSKTNLF